MKKKDKHSKSHEHDPFAKFEPLTHNIENFAPTPKKAPPGFNLDEVKFPEF